MALSGQKGGLHPAQDTGPNPTDRGKPGSKQHVLVDRQGIPLASWLTAANVPDVTMLQTLVEAVEPVNQRRGRPRQRPAKLHGDLGYASGANRAYLQRRGITVRLARKGIESREKLGRYRWVVESTLSWLHGYRRLQIRYERQGVLAWAFLDLACALICFRFPQATAPQVLK